LEANEEEAARLGREMSARDEVANVRLAMGAMKRGTTANMV
jgi:hypothetical protein